MKHKEKRLEYAGQYQTIFAQEWWKVVFSDEKEFNLEANIFPKENYSSTTIVE